jgi:hypothetical protein
MPWWNGACPLPITSLPQPADQSDSGGASPEEGPRRPKPAGGLPRLGELVDEVLFQLWRQLPPVPVDPELEKLLPY